MEALIFVLIIIVVLAFVLGGDEPQKSSTSQQVRHIGDTTIDEAQRISKEFLDTVERETRDRR